MAIEGLRARDLTVVGNYPVIPWGTIGPDRAAVNAAAPGKSLRGPFPPSAKAVSSPRDSPAQNAETAPSQPQGRGAGQPFANPPALISGLGFAAAPTVLKQKERATEPGPTRCAARRPCLSQQWRSGTALR